MAEQILIVEDEADLANTVAFNLEQEMLPNARKICQAVRTATYNS